MAISKIKTVSIEDDAITAGKIVAGAVVADIADDSITGGKFTNDIAINTTGAITTTGAFTSKGIDDNADTTAITIDSSENVGIGGTAIRTAALYDKATLHLRQPDGGSSQGSQLRMTNATTGNDATSGLDISHSADTSTYFHNRDSGSFLFYAGGSQRLDIKSGGDIEVKTGNLVIGTSGKGIDFSATAGPPTSGSAGTSELLDDYEEGTMSLVMGGHTNIGTAAANIQANNGYSGGQAHYVKIGTLCYIQAYFYDQVTSVQSAGELIIQGLPFPAAGNGGSFVTQSYNLTLPSGSVNGTEVAKFSAAGASQLNGLVLRNNATWAAAQASVMPTSTAIYLRIAGTYRTQ